jgi:hypothetical protein
MKLWLDDVRAPWKFGYIGWTWAKTYDEAISYLQTGNVTEASLDHDLSFEDQMGQEHGGFKEKTGYDVICWMEANDVWPKYVECHSANPWGRERIQQVIDKHYGVQ